MQAPSCVFPSFANDTHIMGPMIEIVLAFNRLMTQLILVGLKVKVSKCKLWSPFKHKDSSKLHFGHRWLTHFGCASGFLKLCHMFFYGTLYQDVVHIDHLSLLGALVVVGIIAGQSIIFSIFFSSSVIPNKELFP